MAAVAEPDREVLQERNLNPEGMVRLAPLEQVAEGFIPEVDTTAAGLFSPQERAF